MSKWIRKLKNADPATLMFWLVVILVGIGAGNVVSSTAYMNLHAGEAATHHLLRHITFIGVGGISGVAAWWAVRTRLMRQPLTLAVLTIVTVLLLAMVLIAGVTVNGARRWLPIGSLTFQPSEVAKFVAVLWSAKYLAVLRQRKQPIRLWGVLRDMLHKQWSHWKDWKPLIIPFIFAVEVFRQPDFGTVLIILGVPIMLYIIAGLSLKEIGATLAALVIFFVGAVMDAPYRMERLIVYYDPFRYARDLGYQSVQSIIAVGSGGLVGQGAGRGHSKYAYLPEQYTDFAFSVFAQEQGFLGSVLVLACFVGILWLGWRMAMRTPDRYGRYCIYGLTALLAGQGLYNIGMTVGIMPVTGVPLPFISFGGTSMVMCLTAVGTIIGIWQVACEKRERLARALHREALTGGRPLRVPRLRERA